MEYWIGFYPPGDFWIESAVDLQSYFEKLREMLAPGNFGARSGALGRQFEEEMSEEVMDYSENAYRVKACRDGLILFQHTRLDWQSAFNADPETFERTWASCYDLCNCINLAFHSTVGAQQFPAPGPDSSIFDLREISNRDVGLFSWDDGRLLSSFSPTKDHFHRWRRRQVVSRYDESCLFDMLRLEHAPVLRRSFFDTLNDVLRQLLIDNSAVSTASSLAKSLGQLKIGNYVISLVLSWLEIESRLNSLFEDLLQDKKQRFESAHGGVDSQRCNELIKHLDRLTIYHKSNWVELSDKLMFDRAGRIDSVRSARNRAVHEGRQVSAQDASAAMDMVLEILKERTGVELLLDRSMVITT